ncbi:serpin-ZX [Senna tora]|uniref:Serpin-ZX n=1 Tax=Senna tora TaxID=362788 RepID=A0A834T9C5_9FABA|nr:serpin-ZX [Senna tora]
MDVPEEFAGETEVMLSMAKQFLLKAGGNNNVVLSPLSIHMILRLIAAGSKGSTLHQLLSFLKAKSTHHLTSFASHLIALLLPDASLSGGPCLRFAHALCLHHSLSLKPSFKQLLDSDFKATLAQLDFQTKAAQVIEEINSWAEKETSGLIKEVLPAGSVESSARLVFANALYFKGAWKDKFDESKTKQYDFHLGSGSSVKAPFMTSKKKQYIRACDGFKVLGLPYKQGEDKRRFTMYLFLPDSNDGLSALVEKVGSESGFLERHLPQRQVEVSDFRIPKFKISYGVETSTVLKELGVTLPFCGGELTEMVESGDGEKLYVSSIFHKALIQVNEEGSEAAAASAAVITLMCLPSTIDFVADHPFLFVVREDMSGTLLFIGQLLHPLAG